MNKVIRLKDDSIHIVQSIEDFLIIVEEVMGLDCVKFIEEEIIDVEDENIEYYKELLDKIVDIARGY